MIWGKAIALFCVGLTLAQRNKGKGEMEGSGKKDMGEWEKMDKENMGKDMDRESMRKDHDSIDLCMFTVDDAQCGMVDGCMVISREDYMKRKMEMFGMDDDKMQSGSGRGRMSGSGRERMSGSGRGRMSGSGRRGGEGRRRLQRGGGRGRGGNSGGNNQGPPGQSGRQSGMGPRDSGMQSGSGRGPRDSGMQSGRGPRDGSGRMSGSGRGRMSGSGRGEQSGKRDGNMCVSSCYMVELDQCMGTDGCMVHMMYMDDMMDKKDDMGKGGDDKEQGGKGSGKRGGRRLMERMSGSGRGRMSGSGRGRMSGSGRGEGKMSGSGKGKMSGSGKRDDMKKMMKYCGPKPEREITTGLQVTVTLFTDDKCMDMLDVGGQDRRRLQRKDRNKNKDEDTEVTEDDKEKGDWGKDKEDWGEGKGSGMQSGKGMMKKGYNERQEKRVRENPMVRVIPVVDDLDTPKCSFDARSDRTRGRFRKTTCVEDNVLGVTTYDDVMCTMESEMPAAMPLIFRDECTPLMKYEKGEKDMDDEGKKGGKGRRLMEDEKKGGMMDDMKDMMESKCNEEMGNNSLTDLLKGLMCDEEGEDMEDKEKDMCATLDEAMCKKASKKGCMLKNGVCYNSKAEMGKMNLFAKYDWQYLLNDGELTSESFCYEAKDEKPSVITTQAELAEFCEGQEDCGKSDGGVCAMGKLKKKDKKKGLTAKCAAGKAIKKGKVKCSKLKSEDACAMFEGCTPKSGKKFKCSGSDKLQ